MYLTNILIYSIYLFLSSLSDAKTTVAQELFFHWIFHLPEQSTDSKVSLLDQLTRGRSPICTNALYVILTFKDPNVELPVYCTQPHLGQLLWAMQPDGLNSAIYFQGKDFNKDRVKNVTKKTNSSFEFKNVTRRREWVKHLKKNTIKSKRVDTKHAKKKFQWEKNQKYT